MFEGFESSEFFADQVMVCNVVAVRASPARFEDRRAVDVRDAESGEVREYFLSAFEGELAIELQSICG